MKRILIIIFLLFLSVQMQAQCAMCRVTLENNLSNGDLVVGSSINQGILYLFVAPYLAFAVVAWRWYRNSKKNTATFNS